MSAQRIHQSVVPCNGAKTSTADILASVQPVTDLLDRTGVMTSTNADMAM